MEKSKKNKKTSIWIKFTNSSLTEGIVFRIKLFTLFGKLILTSTMRYINLRMEELFYVQWICFVNIE